MKSVRRSTTIAIISNFPQLSQLQQVEASARTPWWRDISKGTLPRSRQNLPSTKDSSMNSKKQVRSQKRNLPSLNPGSRQRGMEPGGGESSTASSSPRRKKPSSMTGKQARSTQITMTKNPFTVSQSSPHSLLCDRCGRCTFILTLARIRSVHILAIKCSCCGASGKIVSPDLSGILSSSPTRDTIADSALSAGHKVDHASFENIEYTMYNVGDSHATGTDDRSPDRKRRRSVGDRQRLSRPEGKVRGKGVA